MSSSVCLLEVYSDSKLLGQQEKIVNMPGCDSGLRARKPWQKNSSEPLWRMLPCQLREAMAIFWKALFGFLLAINVFVNSVTDGFCCVSFGYLGMSIILHWALSIGWSLIFAGPPSHAKAFCLGARQ